MLRTSVLVVGAGPTGLVLALELGRRGIPALVLSEALTTSTTPKATVTQARTMEHFRRLGLAERVRQTGAPADAPTDIVYCSRLTWHELARHRLPSAAEARRWVREAPWRWHTPELTHRSSQMWIEPILLEECRRHPSIELRLGWRVTSFQADGDGVTVQAAQVEDGAPLTVRAELLVGCDGARSVVREELGIARGDSAAQAREFKGRPMISVHARAPRLLERIPFAKGWLYAAINPEQRGSCISLDGTHFKLSFWQPSDWPQRASEEERRARLAHLQARMFGRSCDFTILEAKEWRGGASLVAEAYRRGRVLLAGDAAHLFTPSAGLGYNTGVDDAVNLGWKLAALVRGWGGPGLLASYELECRPEALRRTRFAAECAERLAQYRPPPELDHEGSDGAAARAQAAAYFADHLPRQYDIPGINFGARYDASPIICGDGQVAPDGGPNHYVPTAVPGGRAPHLWLDDGRSLYDALGPDFTLLRLGPRAPDAAPLCRAARALEIPMTLVELPRESVRELYEADFALIRPDQMVAWRGSGAPQGFEAVLRRVTGWD